MIQGAPVENTKVGPFLILRQLGNNRRQQVFHARQMEQNRDVALKFINIPPDHDRASALDKINRESNVLKNLHHPNLIQVYGAGVEGDRIFFASELVVGESLSSLLARRGTLAWDLVVDIACQIAKALDYLHQNEIVHSKLTPDKIMLDRQGKVKIGDLRLNRNKRRRWDATRRKELEIAAYSAPEQFTQSGASTKSDFYALGVILFECLTGKLPHEPESMAKLVKQKQEVRAPSVSSLSMDCPIWLDKVVSQLLQADPKLRPHSARAIELAMEQVKEIDATRKGAVEEVGGDFNVFNAGVDKTEARRLLGRKVEKPEQPPIFQKAWFLILCLMVCMVAIVYFLIPESLETRMARAERLMASQDDWELARDDLEYLKDQGSNKALAGRAEELFFELKRKALIHYKESPQLTHDPERKDFYRALEAAEEGRLDEAAKLFEQLVIRCPSDGNKRHIRAESLFQLEQLQDRLPRYQIAKKIQEAENASKDGEIKLAISLYEFVLQLCGNDNQFLEFAQLAQQRIDRLQQSNAESGSDENGQVDNPTTAGGN